MGNICRSPSAEGVFRSLLAARAPQLCGRDRFGRDARLSRRRAARRSRRSPPRAVAASTCRRCARARCAASDFDYYDLILAMDEQNLRELRRRAPAQRHERIRLMMEFVPASSMRAVPDPYYGGPQGFEQVLDLLEEAAEGLLREMLSRACSADAPGRDRCALQPTSSRAGGRAAAPRAAARRRARTTTRCTSSIRRARNRPPARCAPASAAAARSAACSARGAARSKLCCASWRASARG